MSEFAAACDLGKMRCLLGRKIVFVSGLPWDYCYHPFQILYARLLALKNMVVWLNPPRRNIISALVENCRWNQLKERVRIFTPVLLQRQYDDLTSLNSSLLALQMRLLFGFHNDPEWILWCQPYPLCRLAQKHPKVFRVFWPGDLFDPVAAFSQMQHFDLILPLSESACDAAERLVPGKTMLSFTGCDVDSFGAASPPASPSGQRLVKAINAMRHPIVGYAGHISAFRMDMALICELCSRMPKYSFVFLGQPDGSEDTAAAIKRITERCSNAFFLGGYEYTELPAMIQLFKVCIIPYKLNDFNRGINPNKLYEYFALGKPVVSSAIPSLAKFSADVSFAGSGREFAEAVRRELATADDPARQSRRRQIAVEHSPAALLARIEYFMTGVETRRE